MTMPDFLRFSGSLIVVNTLLHKGFFKLVSIQVELSFTVLLMSKPGIISSAINFQYEHKLVNHQCQTNWHNLVGFQCQHEHKIENYQCQTNEHDLVSYQCQQEHKLVKYQCKTNGHDHVSNQCQHEHKLVNYQCQTNGHDIINLFIQTRTNYSLTVINAEYLPTNVYVTYRLSLIYVFTRLARIYISIVKPVTDRVIS